MKEKYGFFKMHFSAYSIKENFQNKVTFKLCKQKRNNNPTQHQQVQQRNFEFSLLLLLLLLICLLPIKCNKVGNTWHDLLYKTNKEKGL